MNYIKNLFYIKMIINEKEISTFKEDTKEDLFYRISVVFNTLPEYISEIKDNQVYFINELILKTKDSFEDFYKSLDIFPYLDPETLIHLWLFDKKEFEKSVSKKKRFFKLKVEENNNIYEEIKIIKEQKHTEFKKQRYHISFLSTFSYSLDYLYSNMKSTIYIPFMSFKNICKIEKSFPYNWNESFDNKIIVKLYIENQFITGFISLQSDILTFEISIDFVFSEVIDFKKYISEIFLFPIEFKEKKDEYDIYGVYYFPNFYFNKYIFSHLIMNDTIISKFLSVDESIKASTKKSGILTKFNGGLEDGKEVDVSCNIICKKVDKNDMEIKSYYFTPGSYYVRLRLSSFKDMNTISSFISFLSKVLTIY